MGLLARGHQILGMNARNLQFIRPYNRRNAVQLARNKLATKGRLLERGLPTAKLYGVIDSREDLFNFDWNSLPNSFVLKPNFGLGGNGILIVYGKGKNGKWIGGGDEQYTEEDLTIRVSNILDGNFSISNIPDVAYFEERLTLSEHFKNISYKGIPDVRIIVFNTVPVIAELRLPTKKSGGKANLALGGVGVGIDLETGITTYAAVKGQGEIDVHPDYGTPLRGIRIPYWDEMLRISAEAQRSVGLGYAGIDIVVDRKMGPVVLEVNGHPGLEIQNVNHISLRDRLERIEGLDITSITKGLKVSKDLFGSHVESNYDMPVLGVFEVIDVTNHSGQIQSMRARIDTGLLSTTITKDLAHRLGFTSLLKALDNIVLPGAISASDARQVEDSFRQSIKGLHEDLVDIVAVRSGGKYTIRPKVPLTIKIGGKEIKTNVAIAMDNKLSQPIIIGRRDVHGFLINPSKTK